jgi:AcrR family transcriptional regulator
MQIKKDYTHEQIVVVARGIFSKKGYAKTSMRDIAPGVGIGVSNIYKYLKSKDELFRISCRLAQPESGRVCIVRMSDGTARKVKF